LPKQRPGFGSWSRFYNEERQHQSLGYHTPPQIYAAKCL
jgi:transposase InsO family protein